MKCISKLAMVAAALLTSNTAPASPACVSNDAQLEAAAAAAQDAPMTIMLVRGHVYHAPSAWYAQYSQFYGADAGTIQGGTDILGGYDSTCTTQDPDGSLTTIVDSNTVVGADTGNYVPNIAITGSVVFEGLTLDLTYGLSIHADNYYYDVPPSTQILFRRVKLNGQFLHVSWLQDFPGGYVDIVNSNFSHNGTAYGCVLDVYVGNGSPEVRMVHNTVVSSAAYGGMCFANETAEGSGSGVLFADNNIASGTTLGPDFLSNSPNMELINNLFGTASYPTAPNTVVKGTLLGVNPKLDAHDHPIESPPSPVINYGTTTPAFVTKVDFAGNPRTVGTRPDLGAFESSVNDLTMQTVQNANDHGLGSLRQAILNANASSGFTAIKFHIGSDCATPKVIKLQSSLPNITQSLSIEGFSQPGANPNHLDIGNDATVCIIIDGSSFATAVSALHVPAGVADSMHADISGLAFSGFAVGNGVRLDGGSGHSVSGIHIGGSIGGVSIPAPAQGIVVSTGVHGAQIGNNDPSGRNIIGYTGYAVRIADGAFDNSVRNNYIGVGWGGSSFTNLENLNGIYIAGHDNTIAGNTIGYSHVNAVQIDGSGASGNLISGNGSGTSSTALGQMPNQGAGILIGNGAHDNNVRGNIIAHNAGAGVRVTDGLHNAIRANFIYDNGGLGIDLAGAGVTPKDDDNAPGAYALANRGVNFPELSEAAGTPNRGTVYGTLESLRNTYAIDVYANSACDGLGYGEGEVWLGSKKVSLDPILNMPVGTVAFQITFNHPVPANAHQITATATDADGNTSEFSACTPYLPDEIYKDGFDG